MMNELQRTLRPEDLRDQVTLPAVGGSVTSGMQAGPCMPGDMVDDLTVERQVGQGLQSFLYLAKTRTNEYCLLKLYSRDKVLDSVARNRLSRLRCPALVPIRSMGVWQGHAYESMQLLQGEPLASRMPMKEEAVIREVLPAVLQAMQALHGMRLLHNDLKPENLFWDENKNRVVVLDYGNVTGFDNKQDVGGTPVYMAPEMLFSRGKVRSAASDYCALGLTLGALITGSPLLKETDRNKLRMVWQRNIPVPHGLSAQTRILLNGLIACAPDKRWSGVRLAQWMEEMGIELPGKGPQVARPGLASRADNIQPLRFGSQFVWDIPGLMEAIRDDWDTGVFVLREHRLEPFLMQFGQEYYDICCRCCQVFDRNEGLFRLTQELAPGPEIIWQGTWYPELNAMIRHTESLESLEDSLFVTFCRSRLLGFYLEKNSASGEQLEYVRRLEDLFRTDPQLAFQRLKLSMEKTPTFSYRGTQLRDRKDLFNLLIQAGANLDNVVEELCESQKFEAWLDFQQMGDVIPRVRAEMEVFT